MLCKKIVLAYDDSETAEKALEKTVAIAKTDDSIEVDVLYVIELPQTPYVIEDVFEDMQKSMHEHANAIFLEAKERMTELSNRVEFYSVEGKASQTILDHAAESECDLIVIGSRGLTGIKELLGSVSHEVVHRSGVPVLIVR